MPEQRADGLTQAAPIRRGTSGGPQNRRDMSGGACFTCSRELEKDGFCPVCHYASGGRVSAKTADKESRKLKLDVEKL